MFEVIVFIAVVTLLLYAAFGPIGPRTKRVNGKTRKLEPHEFDWGDGKDVSYYLQFKPLDKLTELERWYMSTQTKDAKISELQLTASAQSNMITKLNQELKAVRKQNESLENYSKKPSMVLDKPKPRKSPYDPYGEDIWYDRRGDVLQFDRDIDELEYQKLRAESTKKMAAKRQRVEYDHLFTMDGTQRTFYDRLHEDDEWDY